MFRSIINAFSNRELRGRILFTCFCVILFKFLSLIPTPGVDSEVSQIYFSDLKGKVGDLFKMINAFSGGAFSSMTVLALNVSPYISATIIVQIYSTFSGSIQREVANSPASARRKIGSLNRYATLALALVQSFLFANYALYVNRVCPGLISDFFISHKIFFYFVFMLSMTSGTMVLLWMSDIMTQKGIGNGVSIIISTGILASSQRLLGGIAYGYLSGMLDNKMYLYVSIYAILFLFVLTWAILLSLGQRNIRVIYARRISGNKVIQGKGSPIIPLRVNYSGIVPVMFSSSILMFFSSIAGFLSRWRTLSFFQTIFVPTSIPYLVLYLSLICIFSYFWAAVQFKPKNIASDLKRSGAFIPGVKQGRSTESFLNSEMHSANMIGTFMLCMLAAMPWILERFFMIEKTKSYLIGGTTLLILVGTVVDVFSQIDGYMASGRTKKFAPRL
ncbi:MAG: preprotein translocase subunit SecY [Chlamydiia bacterium]|nr:preprotein translocase subunit SecY [Chlamydiia bacterium]